MQRANTQNKQTLIEVPIIQATRENTKDYGILIDTTVPNGGLSIPFYKGAVEEGYNLPFEYEGKAVIRTARISKRDSEVKWLEQHWGMTQLFIGLGDQPFAMVLGKPEKGKDFPDLSNVVGFIMPPGHGIMIHKGTWHDFPCAVDKPVTCLTANSEKVVEALASMKGPDEMYRHPGDVHKIDIRKRLGIELHAHF